MFGVSRILFKILKEIHSFIQQGCIEMVKTKVAVFLHKNRNSEKYVVSLSERKKERKRKHPAVPLCNRQVSL